jgi:hypothetical protein
LARLLVQQWMWVLLCWRLDFLRQRGSQLVAPLC